MGSSIKIDYENMPNQSNSIRGQAIEIIINYQQFTEKFPKCIFVGMGRDIMNW